MVEIATSILTVEEDQSTETFYNLEAAGTDYFHIDIMDGKFVEKDTQDLMYKYTSIIKKISNLPLDVHFMVEDIKAGIDQYLSLEPSIITFHYEACENDDEVLEYIRYINENSVKAGLSIKPETDVEKIKKFLPLLHLLLVMTVEPGKGGQKMIPETVEKVRELKEYIDEKELGTYIEVDGGVNNETVHLVKEAGAEILVAGSAVISALDFKEAIETLKE